MRAPGCTRCFFYWCRNHDIFPLLFVLGRTIMLDKYQMETVNFTDGAALVLAGPGSGKTTCILARIISLVKERNIPAERILVITFTKDAALEMQERFRKKAEGSTNVRFGTFHSVFYHILLEHPKYKGYGIIFGKTRLQLLRQAIKEEGALDGKTGFFENVERDIAKYRNFSVNPKFVNDSFQPISMSASAFQKVMVTYERLKREKRKLDFDDMLTKTLELFLQDQAFLEGWQKQFSYYLIDEAQDMNYIQIQLMKLLCSSGNVMAVGDDDQSIYGFRGAEPGVLKEFEVAFQADVLRLQNNYRSLPEIVEKSLYVIQRNEERYEKQLRSQRDGTGVVEKKLFPTEREETEQVLMMCRQAIQEKKTLGILFRNNQEATPVIYGLLRERIPFFSKEKYRLVFSDPISQRLMDLLERIVRYRKSKNIEEIEQSFLEEMFDDDLQRDNALRLMEHMSPYATVNYIRKGLGFDQYMEYIAESQEQYQEYISYADAFQEQIKSSKRLEEALQGIRSLQQFQLKKAPIDPESTYIRLYTFHGSKGLEFQRVIILNVNEGITPSKKALNQRELQEERRMFYVAMTRAKDELYLYSIQRRRNEILYPSVYLKDLTCPQSDPESRQNA